MQRFEVFLATPHEGDLCGHEKYLKTTIFGLVGQCQGTKVGSVWKRHAKAAKAIYKTKQLWDIDALMDEACNRCETDDHSQYVTTVVSWSWNRGQLRIC